MIAKYHLVSNIRHTSHTVHEYNGRPIRHHRKCLPNRAYKNMNGSDLKELSSPTYDVMRSRYSM